MINKAKQAVWQFTPLGLIWSLMAAERKARAGHVLEALVESASAYYSYRLLALAELSAFLAANWAQHGENMEKLTHGQCDVIGTILLRQNPRRSVVFFVAGLQKRGSSPHSRALMWAGLAEAFLKLGNSTQTDNAIDHALALRERVREEHDRVQAMRQWGRVCRRIGRLIRKRFRFIESSRLLDEAEQIARHPQWGSRSQRIKLEVLRWFLVGRLFWARP